MAGDVASKNYRLVAYTIHASAQDAIRLRRDHFDISAIHGWDGDSVRLEVIMIAAQAERVKSRGIAVLE